MNKVSPAMWALRTLVIGCAVATLTFLVIRRQLLANEAAERAAIYEVPAPAPEGVAGDPGPQPQAPSNPAAPVSTRIMGTKSAPVLDPAELMRPLPNAQVVVNPPPPQDFASSSKSGRVLSSDDMRRIAKFREEQARAAALAKQQREAAAQQQAAQSRRVFAPSSKSAPAITREDLVGKQAPTPAPQPPPAARQFAPTSKSDRVLAPEDLKQQSAQSATKPARQ